MLVVLFNSQEASKGFFTRTRLRNLDAKARAQKKAIDGFDASRVDMSPWNKMVSEVEAEFGDLGAAVRTIF
jgi:hypothetical protein